MNIIFQYPHLLVLLLLIAPVIYCIHNGYILREKLLGQFRARPVQLRLRARLVSVLSFVVLASLLVLAAGPMKVLNAGEQNLTGNFVFLIDVSRSMAARLHCGELTRLDRTRSMMSKIINELPEAKFGFMGLAGLTFVLSELSYDRQYLTDVLENGIFIEVIPMPGSDIANAFHVLLEKKTAQPPVYESVDHVVLLSDGDITNEEIQALNVVIPSIEQAGLEIISVGIGSEEGIPIPTLDVNRECVAGQYERADGKEYYTHLLEEPLRSVAEKTGGMYFHESNIEGLVTYLRSRLADDSGVEPPRQTEDLSMLFLVLLSLSVFGLFLIKRI